MKILRFTFNDKGVLLGVKRDHSGCTVTQFLNEARAEILRVLNRIALELIVDFHRPVYVYQPCATE